MALNTTFGSVNPLVKEEQIPDYLKLSHPISQPEADKTMGMVLKGAGDLLKGGVDASVDLIKTHLSEEIYKRVDAEREPFTSVLRDIAPGGGGIRKPRSTGGTVPADEDAGGEALSYAPGAPGGADDPLKAFARAPGGGDTDAVITEGGADVPEILRGKIRYAEGLKNAIATGTIPPTFYVGNLNDVAKSLRAEFPGFRDYIDQEMSRITGMNPANALVNNLIRDINSFAGGKDDKTTTKAINMVTKFIDEGGDELFPKGPGGERIHPTGAMMIRGIQAGKIGLPEVAEWVAMGRRNQGIVREGTLRREMGSNDVEINRQITMQTLNDETNTAANRYFTTAFISGGIRINDTRAMQDVINRARAGQPILDENGQPATSVWWTQQGAGMQTMIDSIRRDLRQKYLYDKDADGKTIVSKLGAGGIELINKQIEDSLAPYREMKEAILDKDVGIAFRGIRYSEAVLRDAQTAAILSKHPLSAYVIAMQTAKHFQLDDVVKTMSEGYMKNLEAKGLPLSVPSWLDTIGYEALLNHIPRAAVPTAPAPGITPPPAGGGPRTEAVPEKMTIDKAFDEAKTAGAKEPAFKDPAVYKSLVDVVKYIKDPTNTDDGRRGLLTYAFPGGGDTRFLGRLTVDTYEKGVFKPGRFSTFEEFTRKDLVEHARRLHGDKWNFRNLLEWADGNFSGPLMGDELKTLEKVGSPYISFAWDSKTREFSAVVDPSAGTYTTPEGGGVRRGASQSALMRQLADVQPSIDRLNTAFKGLGNVYDAANLGDQLEKRVVAMLAANNIRGTVGGTEFKVMDALIKGKTKETPAPGHERAPGKGSRLDMAPSDYAFHRAPYEGVNEDFTEKVVGSGPRVGRYATMNLSNERLLNIEEVP